MKSWRLTSHSAEQTQLLGACVGRLCPSSFVILLEGDLGSGKTCLTQGLARGLDVPPQVVVNSPTYTLMNQYPGRFTVSHFDLYRLSNADELHDLDFDAYLSSNGVAIVEWAGLVEPEGLSGVSITISYGESVDERILQFSPLDQTGETLLQQLTETWKENQADAES